VKLSIVVPCYNEEKVLHETNGRLITLISSWGAIGLINEYEIIYINDGSQDDTLNILKQLAGNNKNIKVISFSGNFGHQAALTAGLYYASGDAAVSMDADLQDPPEVIEKMLDKFNKGFDIVYGVRSARGRDGFFKKLSAKCFYRLMKLIGVPLVYEHADFRLLSASALTEFKKYTEVNRFLRGIIPLMGFNNCVVEYERKERFAGETKYPLKKMLIFAIEGLTSLSLVPLRIVSFAGLIMFFVSVLLSIWALFIKMKGMALPGWTSTVLPIYFLGGIQLIFLGIIGEYIGKIYLEVKKRPLFIIKEKYNLEDY
jgi:polyisoprenyl-phosphate glycosyltransferase